MKYLDINVRISPARGENYQVLVDTAGNQHGNSELTLPFRLSDISPSIIGASSTNRGTSFGDLPPERLLSAEEVGVELFEALFKGENGQILKSMEDQAERSQNTGVRIRITMNLAAEGMAEVASLPWELMRRRNQLPLVVSVYTPVVRAFDTVKAVRIEPIVGKLRILLVVSNPKGTNQLDLGNEKQRIIKIWQNLNSVVEFVECPPIEQKILDLLAETDFHILHYMGHGNFDNGVGGEIILEDEDGNAESINGSMFAGWLQDRGKSLRLVFLNACDTGTTGEQAGLNPFAGVASSLINCGMDSILAMQFPISNKGATIFSETFYKRIAQGNPIEEAVSEGRKMLHSKGAEWATPVLYMRADHGDLFGQSNDGADKPIMARPSAVQPDPLPVPEHQPAPQQFLSETPPAKPWYKKPLVWGGAAAFVLLLLIVRFSGGEEPVQASDAAAQATETADAATPQTDVEKALAPVADQEWANDPDCKVALRVFGAPGVDTDKLVAASKEGNAKASYVVGCVFGNGLDGQPSSLADAAPYYERASNAGLAQAQFNLAVIYETGAPAAENNPAITIDPTRAQQLYEAAAKRGNTAATEKVQANADAAAAVADEPAAEAQPQN